MESLKNYIFATQMIKKYTHMASICLKSQDNNYGMEVPFPTKMTLYVNFYE